MLQRRLRLVLHHGAAVLAVAVALLVGRLLDASPGELQIALLHAAVAVTVWYGGAVPALLATALGGVAVLVLFTEHAGPSQQSARLLGYLLSCSIIVAFGHALRIARRHTFVDLAERRRLEQFLRAVERDFRTVFELAAVGAAQVDPITGRFLRVNQRLCDITGYSESELLALTFAEITHPDDRQREAETIEPVDRGELDAFQYEKRYVRKGGGIIWVLVNGRMIRDSEGRLSRTAAHILDITERKQAEQALQRSEARYRALLQATTSAVWTWDPATGQGEYDQVQAWWQELTGQSPEAQRGTGWLDLVHPDDRRRATAAWTRAMTSGSGYDTEYRVHTRTGEYRHLVSRAVPIHEDGATVREWVGMLADVTEQQLARDALRHSEELLRLIADAVPALIAYVDADGRYRLANRSYERWFGLTPEQIRGRHVRDVLGEVSWRAVEPHVRRALAGQETVYEQELEYRCVGRRWVRGTYTPDRDLQGRVRGFAVLVNDITERKQAEDALREVDRRKDEFLATLAHELRNPLAPIRSSLQLLKTPAADPAAHERAREMMERQLHHLVRLVDDLLDVSRIMRGKIELRMDVVTLDTVIARALETAQPLIDAQRHSLVVSLPDQSAPLRADPVRLTQVVGNLLTNAAKYTEPGGQIRLAVERSGSDVLIRVRDNGIGIAPDMQSRIFDLFTQVDHSTARAQGGLGIGLTLVKSLVEMHHGSVEVHSAGLGHGSELIVRLPAEAAEPTQPAEPAEPAQPAEPAETARQPAELARDPANGNHGDLADEIHGDPAAEIHDQHAPATHGRVLVVDDNTDAGETLAMLLGLYGYQVEAVGSGMAALELIPAFRPDVIFLDIGMPVMDGYEVARRLREQPAGQQAYLVALTGWGQAEDRRRTREAGFDHHFIKPVAPEAVRELLARVIESRRD
ncbi:MAG TPA: PAS domain S-box protein [Haliangium sp.]|nr:PAS domain S-box protein [Haliangium sp.]